MNSKTWLTFFAVVSVLLIGGAGFFCFNSFSRYNEAKSGWDNNLVTIKALEKRTPHPNPKNVGILQGIVDEYKSSVDGLFQSLNTFQKPLKEDVINVIFRDSMTQRVGLFRDYASAENFEIVNSEEFGLGFERYKNDLPLPEIVSVLEYELDAIERLLKMLVESGAERLDYFSRDVIPGEAGGPEEQDISTVHKYPVRLGFRTSHKSFESFINTISNDKENFYVVRVLKVDNESPEGPLKVDSLVQSLEFEHQETRIPATLEQKDIWGVGSGIPNDQIIANAANDGFELSGNDARILMGQEKLDIFMVVDIIRFLDPATVKSE